ncbi:uncharacterized protein LOC143283104 [Babylonia areolata]|uniref:uncharacterized protein LOC143283104 n=1 Tax=Babylonia areolata TaxID=304850 RepID=UPI003FD0AE15
MADVSTSVKSITESCVVCCNKLQINEQRLNSLDKVSFYSQRIRACSNLCQWQLQYNLGIVHGFLLCDILHRFLDRGTVNCKLCGQSLECSYLCDSTFENSINFLREETSGISIPIKKEESMSDLEDLTDCTVSFQNSVDDSIDSNEKTEEPEILQIPAAHFQTNSVKSLNRKVHSTIHATTITDRAKTHRKQKAAYSVTGKLKKNTKLKPPKTVAEKPSDQTKRKIKNNNRADRKFRLTLKRKPEELSVHWDSAEEHKDKLYKGDHEEKEEERAEPNRTKTGEDTPLRCDFCSKSFTAQRFLQRHLNRFHPKEIEITCDICGDSCKNQKYLSIHIKKEHNLKLSEGEEVFHCDQCSKSFHSRRGLALHREFVHSQENLVSCKLCDLTLKNDIYLKRHMKRSHSDSIICHICGAKFKSRLALTSHLSAHKGVKSFFCEVCGMGFVRKTSLRRHVQQHTDVSYTCDTCPSSYKTWGSLSLHMLQIHQRGSYFNNRLRSVEKLGYMVDKEAVDRHLQRQCVTCGEKLVSGVCATHPESFALMFKCHHCELTAEHVDDLLAHLKDHNSGTASSTICISFDCKVCHKVFPRKLYLKQHLRRHHPGASMTSLTPHPSSLTYCCQVCGKHFKQKQYLYVHMKQHLQPGSFACHVCDRKFTYKCNLKNHLTTHSQDKPFKCDVCLKLFRRKEVLSSHRLVHNPTLSPFKCHLCGKGLSRKQYLKKHYQVMHPEWQEGQQVLPPLSSSSPPV